MSRIESNGRQHCELDQDFVRAGPPGEPLCAFLTLFYYGKGVFTWMSKDNRSLWWSPQPRAVLFCHELNVNRTLRKVLRRGTFRVTTDTAFDEVVRACSDQVRGMPGDHGSTRTRGT
jgi:leucyl/phenylalanyl-tRNA--protein transferase